MNLRFSESRASRTSPKLPGNFASQHPDFASVAARLQIEGQAVCSKARAGGGQVGLEPMYVGSMVMLVK